jgi:hypothetical protein
MNHAFSKILVLVILMALAGGGIFAWQYFGTPEEVQKEEVKTKGKVEEKVLSEESKETVEEVEGSPKAAVEEPLTVQDVFKNSDEAYEQWNEFYALYSSNVISSLSGTDGDDYSKEVELVIAREKEGKKLRQEVYRASILGEGAEMRFTGSLQGTTYHLPDGNVIFCMGEAQFCKSYTENVLQSVQVILSLLGNESEHLQRLSLPIIDSKPLIKLSYDGTREITYHAAILSNRKEIFEKDWASKFIKKTAVCDRIGVEFYMKELTEFTRIGGEKPYGDTDPELSSFRGEICLDRETGLASYGEMEVLQISLAGIRGYMKTQMELRGFINFHKEPEGLIFPEEVLKF